jgi:hypothetical protein
MRLLDLETAQRLDLVAGRRKRDAGRLNDSRDEHVW